MPKYTLTILDLEENNFDFQLNQYPIFDEEYRPILNQTILDYYRFREIGFQNPAVWRDRLKSRMNIIMRNKYNLLYQNKMIEFNPLYNIDITETFEHKIDTDNNTSVSGTQNSSENSGSMTKSKSKSKDISASYPTEKFAEAEELEEDIYADSGRRSTLADETSNDTSGTSSMHNTGESTGHSGTVEEYQRKTLGSSAGLPFSKAMLQFKDFVDKFNLDLQVCKELSDLFINIY